MDRLTEQKDVFFYTLQQMNDKTLFSFCLTNPKIRNMCNSEKAKQFWLNRLFINFPFNWNFRTFDVTPKQFYFRLVYLFNKYTPNRAMIESVKLGRLDMVNFFIEKGADDWIVGMMLAAEGGHKDIVDFFIEKGVNNWNIGMQSAAEGGHKDLVKFFIKMNQ